MVPVFERENEKFYLMEKNPTAENIAELIYDFVAAKGYPVASVTLWESDTSYARYSR